MSSNVGKNFIISIFGESHGNAIGINIDGIPPGFKIDFEEVRRELKRRAPGNNALSTPRKEADEFEVLSGYFDDHTTGAPLCAITRNSNTRSKDYSKTKDLLRPSHADYTGHVRYDGFNDYRGGGHFSGRITAPLVFAGAIAKQILREDNIIIGSHISSIGEIDDLPFDDEFLSETSLKELSLSEFPTLNSSVREKMIKEILHAKDDDDSIGGSVQCGVINLPVGIGSPFFDSVESKLSHLLFSIPAVKGVLFGEKTNSYRQRGSRVNDSMYMENGRIKCKTNYNGGVIGGITNGMPLVFTTLIKPTPSIKKEQDTVNLSSGKNEKLSIKGRHDPCIVQRALPVIEAVCAIAILDLILDRRS
jgi:chorismate synthase